MYMGNNVNKDLTGFKYNRLLVIEPKWITKKSGATQKGWNCLCDCGNIKWYLTHDLKSGKVKSCGCYNKEVATNRMLGENNMGWKGGTTIDSKGYVVIKHGENRGKLQHRHIYEKHYGVTLKSHQSIHHINGNRADNRIENLELWDTSQPKGQRIEDKILFYHQLIQEYKDHPKYRELIVSLDHESTLTSVPLISN